MKVYFSSPYEFSRADQSWKETAYKALRRVDKGVKFVDPCPAECDETDTINQFKANEDWLAMYAFCANIVEGDLAMLNQCEGMICYLPAGSKTVGSIHEIIHALERRIPVVLVTPEGIDKVSHWLWGLLGPTRIFDNLELACQELVKRMQVARGVKTNGQVYYTGRTQTSR